MAILIDPFYGTGKVQNAPFVISLTLCNLCKKEKLRISRGLVEVLEFHTDCVDLPVIFMGKQAHESDSQSARVTTEKPNDCPVIQTIADT